MCDTNTFCTRNETGRTTWYTFIHDVCTNRVPHVLRLRHECGTQYPVLVPGTAGTTYIIRIEIDGDHHTKIRYYIKHTRVLHKKLLKGGEQMASEKGQEKPGNLQTS